MCECVCLCVCVFVCECVCEKVCVCVCECTFGYVRVSVCHITFTAYRRRYFSIKVKWKDDDNDDDDDDDDNDDDNDDDVASENVQHKIKLGSVLSTSTSSLARTIQTGPFCDNGKIKFRPENDLLLLLLL